MGWTDRLRHGWLALWLAVLLALAPASQRPVSLDPAAVQPIGRDRHAAALLAGLQSGKPARLGILSRLSPAPPTFGPTPAKSVLRSSATEAFAPPLGPARAPKDAVRAGIDHSAVGTARTPTGPPF
jgi:hypothetical protein